MVRYEFLRKSCQGASTLRKDPQTLSATLGAYEGLRKTALWRASNSRYQFRRTRSNPF
jgi:hypothetical protein